MTNTRDQRYNYLKNLRKTTVSDLIIQERDLLALRFFKRKMFRFYNYFINLCGNLHFIYKVEMINFLKWLI
jgi:hypothetical protein